jgi:hypothetical protein
MTTEYPVPWKLDDSGRPIAEPVFPRIDVTGDGGAEIWMGMRKIARLEAGEEALVNRIYQHMREDHGEDDARVYLTGVIHGLREAALERMAETLQSAKETRERGEVLMERTRRALGDGAGE